MGNREPVAPGSPAPGGTVSTFLHAPGGDSGAGVAVIWWPSQAARRDLLARAGIPRLLVVEDGPLPDDLDESLEDWVRLPADEDDVTRRLEMLSARLPQTAPWIDEYDVVHWRGRWVALSEGEARIARPLVEHYGEIVPRSALVARASHEGTSSMEAVRVYMSRLRRRLSTLGLSITTVRARGYSLGVEPLPASGAKDSGP